MLLRKSRKHLHGASNRAPNEASFYNTFYKPCSAPKKEILKKQNVTCSTSHLKTRPHFAQHLRNSHDLSQAQPEHTQGQSQLEQQLRKMYQGRRSIVKAIDGWGFDARGFITRQAFIQKLSEKLGYDPAENDLEDLLHKYCKNREHIDAKELITIIHGKTEGSLFNQTLFSADEPSRQRQMKIDNLKESIKAYHRSSQSQIDYSSINKFLFKVNSCISKMKDLTDGHITPAKSAFFAQLATLGNYAEAQREALRKIEAIVDYEQIRYNIQSHVSVDQLFLDPILRNTHINRNTEQLQEAETFEPFLNKMAKSSTNPFKLLRNSEKRLELDPRAMLNTNQQKTRFGQSKFTQESFIPLPLWKENVSPNQKDLVLQTIKSEADLHRQRYENKLEKLRLYRQNESENIARKEQEAQMRQRNRMQRIRHDQQAYNYVNFIKKKWE